MTAPVVPTPQRNRLGIAALVLVLIAIALPILTFIVFTVAAIASGAQGDDIGYAILGGFFVAAAGVAIVAPLAIIGVVLAVIALTRRGLRKVQAVVALVLGIAPAIAVIGLPAAIDSLF
jgi:hypothetical protein